MHDFFYGIGTTVVRRRWLVLAAWAALLVFGIIYAPRLSEVFEREFVSGNTGDSQQVADVISEEFSQRSAFAQQLVITSDSLGVNDPGYREGAALAIAAVESTGFVESITSYYSSGDARLVSDDGRTTYAIVDLRSTTHADGLNSAKSIIEALEGVDLPGQMAAFITGIESIHADLDTGSQESAERAERVALPITLLVLILVFGGLVAAGVPLLLAIISIVISLALAYILGQSMNLSSLLRTFATLLGLGVGIDYALFMLTRYRHERKAGRTVDTAAIETVTHAGKAIAFSGLAVVIGLSALLVTGDPIVTSIGVGGVLVVAVAVLAALTLLPVIIVLLGDRIESPRALTRLIEHRVHRGGFWSAWARRVMAHPVRYLLIGLFVFGAISWPVFGLSIGSMGVNVLGEEAHSRQGYELLAEKFDAGLMSPVQIVVRADEGIDDPSIVAGIARLTNAIETDARFSNATSITSLVPDLNVTQYQAMYSDGFAGVPAQLAEPLANLVNLERGADTALIFGVQIANPGTEEARQTVRALRDEIVPSVPELSNAEVLVGGSTALEIDAVGALYSRFPLVVGLILASTFLLLMMLFRSILIPLKAVFMNLLSVAGAYGLLVLVFQKGYGAGLFGFTATGEITWSTPVLLFAVLFGLSMDYEVFLLSRIRELRDRGHSTEDSVAAGLERTGGVITGAALIMVVVFAAFLLSPILMIKEIGFALAVAIFLDATIVRTIIVPATMRLLGNWNWWLPESFERVLPHVELEKEVLAPVGND